MWKVGATAFPHCGGALLRCRGIGLGYRCTSHICRAKGFAKANSKSKKPKKSSSADSSSATLQQQQALLQALSDKSSPKSKEEASTSSAQEDEEVSDFTIVKGTQATKRQATWEIKGDIYDHPMYYDWAFGFRKYEDEVDFLFDAYEELRGTEPTSFVELGCGPAQHSLEMAESGLQVFAVDNNENMLTYATELAEQDNLKITFLRQDMRDLALPDGAQVDLIACLLGTFQHMMTADDALKCFKAAERALKPGGLLVIELSHPSTLFDGSIASSADFWNIELDEAQVEVLWGKEGDAFDPLTQVLQKNVQINIMLRGGDMLTLGHTVPMRQFTYQELLLLAQMSGLRVHDAYSDFSMDTGMLGSSKSIAVDHVEDADLLDNEDDDDADSTFRMIVFFQKPDDT